MKLMCDWCKGRKPRLAVRAITTYTKNQGHAGYALCAAHAQQLRDNLALDPDEQITHDRPAPQPQREKRGEL